MDKELVRFEIKDNTLVCVFNGRLDTANTNKLDAKVFDQVQRAGLPTVFEMGAVDYICSAFLRLCIKSSRAASEPITVLNAARFVRDAFEMTGLNKIMNIAEEAPGHMGLFSPPVDFAAHLGSLARGGDGIKTAVADDSVMAKALEIIGGDDRPADAAAAVGKLTAEALDRARRNAVMLTEAAALIKSGATAELIRDACAKHLLPTD